MTKESLAFVGAGRMAGAMVRGIIKHGWPAHSIRCISAPDGTAETLAQETGIRSITDWAELIHESTWIILACKPQQLKELPPALPSLAKGKSILSILAGTTIDRLRKLFPEAQNIVRCMPNTPGMIGEGISVYSAMQPLSDTEEETVQHILGALGKTIALPEASLDAVTGLSGSGPAYVFEFVAALRDGGIAAGLDEKTAYALALQTVKGAALLLEAVPETPETHRQWVSSPGGTTLAGLSVMEVANIRRIMQETIVAATQRAGELAKE